MDGTGGWTLLVKLGARDPANQQADAGPDEWGSRSEKGKAMGRGEIEIEIERESEGGPVHHLRSHQDLLVWWRRLLLIERRMSA
jgi:hypothetical protein